jgi:hypothetical protein
MEPRIAKSLASLKDEIDARDLVHITNASLSSLHRLYPGNFDNGLANAAVVAYEQMAWVEESASDRSPQHQKNTARYPRPTPELTKRGRHPVQLSTRRTMSNVTLGIAHSASRDKQSIKRCGFLNNDAVQRHSSTT